MNWKENALNVLNNSLFPVPTELNELDWKSGLSCKTERLAQHISAFSNMKGGGLLVYGVNNDGTCFSVSKEEADKIIQQLGNIAKNNLTYAVTIEHSIIEYKGNALLFIYIPEQHDKPVFLRGKDIFDSYIRSAGQTVKMSRNQVKALIAESQGLSFENRIIKEDVKKEQVVSLLNYQKMFQLLDKNIPVAIDSIISKMEEFGFCVKNTNGLWGITNLGAILFANDISDFRFGKACCYCKKI